MQITAPELSPDAQVVVWLWGFDDSLADASASLIAQYQLPGGSEIDLDIPSDPHTLIDQGQGPVPQSSARFYFSVYADENADGQICPGDFQQDYDETPYMSYATPPSRLSVVLTRIEAGTACMPARR